MVSEITESEEDEVAAGGLQRCLNSLHRQTSGVDGVSQKLCWSGAKLEEVTFTEYNLAFTEGVDPHRVFNILDSLRFLKW